MSLTRGSSFIAYFKETRLAVKVLKSRDPQHAFDVTTPDVTDNVTRLSETGIGKNLLARQTKNEFRFVIFFIININAAMFRSYALR